MHNEPRAATLYTEDDAARHMPEWAFKALELEKQ